MYHFFIGLFALNFDVFKETRLRISVFGTIKFIANSIRNLLEGQNFIKTNQQTRSIFHKSAVHLNNYLYKWGRFQVNQDFKFL